MTGEKKLTRREREKLRQKREILDAALELFCERGFQNVSMLEIAKKSEFAVGTLYKFFNDKEDLYKTLILEQSNKFHEALTEAIEEAESEIDKLTQETISGNIPFIESFIRRVNILSRLSVSEINQLLKNVTLSKKVTQFIDENKDECAIVTGNFGAWIEKLMNRIGCKYFSSDGLIEDNQVIKLTHVLKKEEVVKQYKAEGKTVVFIGDGNNDAEAMREADISIACGLVHYPAKSVLMVADYAVFDDEALYRLLNQISSDRSGKSIVLSCAGVGSRLGLGQSKVLIDINGEPLIHWHLKMFENFEDIRIVIGFQANDIIKATLEKRRDVIFVYNHNYFDTKTGTSYYLGARHGNEYAIEWDGDLIVHPNDVAMCLEYEGDYVGCSSSMSDDPVYVKCDENYQVVSFSRENGDYEWTGPASMKKNKIKYTSVNVFNQIEEYLPLPLLKVRAQDIDTYDDYKRALEIMAEWQNI